MSKRKTTTTQDYSGETSYYADSSSTSGYGDTQASSARGFQPGRTIGKVISAGGDLLNNFWAHPQYQGPSSSGMMTQRTRGIGPQTQYPGHTNMTVPRTQRPHILASRVLAPHNNQLTNGPNAQPSGLPPGMTPTIVNAQDINFQHDAEYQMVPVPTAAFVQSARSTTTPVATPPIIIMPSLTKSISSSSSRISKPRGVPAYNSSRGRKPDPDDPEILLKSANHRFHAWFKIPGFIQSQKHNTVQGSKVSPILEKMKFAVEPFNAVLECGRVWINREKNDELFNDLIGFVDVMDSLLADFISLYPDFILHLSKRLRKDMLWMHDTPSNKEWIQMVRDVTSSKGRKHSAP